MERRGSGIKKILDETAKLPGYTEELKPLFQSTVSSFSVTLKNINYLSQSVSDQVSDRDTDQVVTEKILEFCRSKEVSGKFANIWVFTTSPILHAHI